MRTRHLISLCSLVVLACTPALAPEDVPCATPDDATAQADITLTAKDAVLTPAEGVNFVAWTFDGDVPGPTLRIPLGVTRRIKLINKSPRPVSLHFHGVEYSEDDDGTPEHPTSVVNPGCSHVTTITAHQPGVWPFHSHVDSRAELANGLSGAVIVPDPAELNVAHEYVAFLGQLGLEDAVPALTGEAAELAGDAPRHFFMTINGRPFDGARVIELLGGGAEVTDGQASAHVGDRIRWRVLNVSPDEAHSFHLHGHRWCDGAPIDATGRCPTGAAPIDVTPLSPAQGATLEYVEDNPGDWMYHCHVLDHANDGMTATYHVEP